MKAKTEKIFGLVGIPSTTYEYVFFDHWDLKYIQKKQFVGFPGIPEDELRIIEIQYSFTDRDGWICMVSCATDKNWSAAQKLGYVFNRTGGR